MDSRLAVSANSAIVNRTSKWDLLLDASKRRLLFRGMVSLSTARPGVVYRMLG